jgi:Flp pilus assembly protein TadD
MTARTPRLVWLLAAALALAWGGRALAATEVGEQLSFGAKMAQRGLWNEALFRFRQAGRLAPGNARVLNNLAVALEATGRFDEALTTYQEALKLDPGNAEIKRNYARFAEFYQAYKPRAKAPAQPAAQPPAEDKAPEPPAEDTPPEPPAGDQPPEPPAENPPAEPPES